MSWAFLNEMQRGTSKASRETEPPRRFSVTPFREAQGDTDPDEEPRSPRRVCDTLVISDVHLGSPVSTVKMLRDVLADWNFRNLVILGDLFDSGAFHRLRKHHWKLLGDLRRLADPDNGRQIVWVAGNHDDDRTFMVASMIGATIVEEDSHCEFEVGGKKYVALHGHQFDRFILSNPVQTAIGASAYLLVQRMEFLGRRRFSRWLKRQSKKWLHVAEKIAESAVKYGRRFEADFVLCGHTHHPQRINFGDITYVNSGCWTEYPSTLVAIDEDGPHLIEYWGDTVPEPSIAVGSPFGALGTLGEEEEGEEEDEAALAWAATGAAVGT
jgi:UDP-2,3-diacylglucosamine pyrophosphatase LpxH